MKVRADFSKRETVRTSEAEWVASPQPGVDRLLLDRIGGEIARATSLVRFRPGSFFPFHAHGGGEEVFVVDGVFEDEYGRYPTGTYLRDPVGSSHAPFAKEGCTLFVRLWQFDPQDKERLVLETASGVWGETATPGFAVMPLHSFGGVSTSLLRLAPGARLDRAADAGGEEVLVLDGSFRDAEGDYPKGAWIRDPGACERSILSPGGCVLLVKTGHLPPDLSRLQELEIAAAER